MLHRKRSGREFLSILGKAGTEDVPLLQCKLAGRSDNANQPHYHQSAKEL